MTLLMAFVGKKGAAVAGDMREVLFRGDEARRRELESELYDGRIVTDADLEKRAAEIGVRISVRDDKSKVVRRDDGVLTGEVSKFERGTVSRRRIYAAAGQYAIADFEGGRMVTMQKKEGSAFVVLGNDITKKIANEIIRKHWKNGGFEDAVRVIVLAMEEAGRRTASVSRAFSIEQTDINVNISAVVDSEAGGS
ncbi:MAG: DUF2121 domain-containing protein [Methanomicrobiaceae archaeon]|nr:DUF2121 domain-containing protein [Methanomicrobiaceae archaeon]